MSRACPGQRERRLGDAPEQPVSATPAWANEVDGALNPVPVSRRLRDEGLTSKKWLRVYMTYTVGAGGSPRLDEWRQHYDCIANE